MTAPAQPPVKPDAPRDLRAWSDFDGLEKQSKGDRITMGEAVIITLLLHAALFFWILPWLGKSLAVKNLTPLATAKVAATPAVQYSLAPMTPEDEAAFKYVEANPNAPVAKPDPTKNISDRDQHVAQPTPNPNGNADKPSTDGKNEQSSKIVAGSLGQPTPPAPAPTPAAKPVAATPPTAKPNPPTPQLTPSQSTTTPMVASLLGTPGNDSQGVRYSDKPDQGAADKIADNASPNAPKFLPQPDQPSTPNNFPDTPHPLTPELVAASAAAATPQARISVQANVPDGPVAKSVEGTHIGGEHRSYDAKFTKFGEYLTLMFEAIDASWRIECDKYNFTAQDLDTEVDTTFVINQKGEVEELQVVTSTSTRGATILCENAIKNPAPFGPWTKEMIAELGEKQTIRIDFFYE